jgi:hypothetical protein
VAKETELGTLLLRLKAEFSDLKKGLNDAQKMVKDSSDSQKKSHDTLGQSIAGIKTEYLKFAAAAIVVAATIKKAFDWSELGAKAEAAQESFSAVTKGMGVNGEQLKSQIKSASGVYADETEIMIMSNKLLAEGVSAADIPKLFESARVAARFMGTDVNTAMELVTRAVLTFQTRGLFRQAFPMESEKVFEKYAESMGKDVDMLSTFAKQQAMVNEILRMTVDKMQLLGGPLTRNHYENLQLLSSAYMEAKEMIGKFIVDGVMWLADGMTKLIGILDTTYQKVVAIPMAIKGLITSASKFLGFTSEKPAPVELAVSHGAAAPELEIAVSHGAAEREKKSLVDEDKLQKALTKIRLDAEKARVDAEGQIRIYNLDSQHNRILEQAAKTGQDTLEIDLEFAKKKAAVELENTLASLKIQEKAEVAAAVADKKTREISGIKAKIRQQEFIAEGKYQNEVTKLDYDEAKKRIDRKLALDDASTKDEISNQQAVLDQAQDYYDRLLISAKSYYKIKEDITLSMGTSEIRMLQERLDLETDEGKKADLRAQVIEKTNKLEKDLTTNRWDAYKALQSEVELHNQILQTDTNRLNVTIDMAREKFEITEADALRQRIQLQTDLLAGLNEQLSLTDKISDPKKYADIQLAIAQVNAQVQTLNISLTEQVGSFAQLSDLGMKRYADSVQKNLINTTENLLPNAFDTAGNAFKGFIDNLTSGTMSAKDAIKKFFDDFSKGILNSITDIILLIAKTELLKALGYGTGTSPTASTGTSGGGIGGIFSTIIGFIGGLFQTGGVIRGPSGKDKVPIRATAGEYIVQESAVKKYGVGFMSMVNQGLFDMSKLMGTSSRPQFAFSTGGFVSGETPRSTQGEKNEITLINVIDSRDMDKWAASAAGQNAVLNVLSSRMATVKKIMR